MDWSQFNWQLRRGDFEAARQLLESVVDKNKLVVNNDDMAPLRHYGHTPLHEVCMCDFLGDNKSWSPTNVQLDAFRLLLWWIVTEGGIDVNVIDSRGQTPLHCLATGLGDGGWVVRELLKLKINARPDGVSKLGPTPLALAVVRRKHSIVKELLKARADPTLARESLGRDFRHDGERCYQARCDYLAAVQRPLSAQQEATVLLGIRRRPMNVPELPRDVMRMIAHMVLDSPNDDVGEAADAAAHCAKRTRGDFSVSCVSI